MSWRAIKWLSRFWTDGRYDPWTWRRKVCLLLIFSRRCCLCLCCFCCCCCCCCRCFWLWLWLCWRHLRCFITVFFACFVAIREGFRAGLWHSTFFCSVPSIPQRPVCVWVESCVSPIARLEFVCTCVTCRQCDDGQLHLRRFHVASAKSSAGTWAFYCLPRTDDVWWRENASDCVYVIWMWSLPIGSATRDQDTALVHASTHHSPLRGHRDALWHLRGDGVCEIWRAFRLHCWKGTVRWRGGPTLLPAGRQTEPPPLCCSIMFEY